ncbi:MAG: GNAT family N-acyltransferase [Pseudoxanthomonas sp.]
MNDNVVPTVALTAASAPAGRELPRGSMAARGEPLRVRRIEPGEPLGDVQRLRREVYFQEQGRNDKLHSRRVADGLDASGTIVVVEEGRKAVATLRVHDFGSPAVQVEYGSLFQIDRFARSWPLERVAVCTRFAVQADQRANAVVDALVEETKRHAHEHGVQFGLIACEPFLYSVFEHYGFREYLPPVVMPSGLALLRMALVVDDAASLQECDSPLLPLVRHPVAGSAAHGWLMRTFPEKTSAI